VLLLGAWFFRWEKGPTQTINGDKIVHLRDRWLGQSWVLFYGRFGEDFLSGEEVPYIKDSSVKERAEVVLKGPVGLKKRNELEKRLSEAQAEKETHSKGHTEYVRRWEALEVEYRRKYPQPEGLEGLISWDLEKNDWIRSRLPAELIQECNAWRRADRRISEIEGQIRKLPQWAKEQAKKQLTAEAYRNRNIATGVWVSLVALSFVTGVVLFVREYRRLSKNRIVTEDTTA